MTPCAIVAPFVDFVAVLPCLCRFRPFSIRSAPVFGVFLRLACVLWCVVCVLRLKIKRICDDNIKVDKIYGFSFFVRLRAYFGACLVFVPVRAFRPSVGAGGAGGYFLKSGIPLILPYQSPNKNFSTL